MPPCPCTCPGSAAVWTRETFALPPLGTSRYAVIVHDLSRASQAFLVDPAVDAERELVFELREGFPVVFEPLHGNAELLVVHVLDAAGVPVFSENVRGGLSPHERLRLPPGSYTLVQVAPDGRRSEQPFVVVPELETRLVLGP